MADPAAQRRHNTVLDKGDVGGQEQRQGHQHSPLPYRVARPEGHHQQGTHSRGDQKSHEVKKCVFHSASSAPEGGSYWVTDDNALFEARNQDRLLLILKFHHNLRGFTESQQLVQESACQPPGTLGVDAQGLHEVRVYGQHHAA